MLPNKENMFYDCHLHFPIKMSEPVVHLLKELDGNTNLKGFVLILNSSMEEELYLKNIEFFQERNYIPAFLLDVNSEICCEKFKKLEDMGMKYVIKIHPRISKIIRDDFARIKESLEQLSFQTVIVDNWFFGSRIENHIGTELAIYIAERFPDKAVVSAHAGGCRIVECMLLTRPIKNIFYDLSLTQMYFKGSSLEMDIDYFIKWTSERILFGSDYPDFGISEAWNAFREHYDNAGQIDKLSDSSELARKIYGLK